MNIMGIYEKLSASRDNPEELEIAFEQEFEEYVGTLSEDMQIRVRERFWNLQNKMVGMTVEEKLEFTSNQLTEQVVRLNVEINRMCEALKNLHSNLKEHCE